MEIYVKSNRNIFFILFFFIYLKILEVIIGFEEVICIFFLDIMKVVRIFVNSNEGGNILKMKLVIFRFMKLGK